MNSFIPWIGGKKLLREKVISLFPQQGVKSYVEVFGGAGWVLFARESHAAQEVLNDIDGNLVNLYRCIQHHREELERELRKGGRVLLNARELFFDYRAQMDVRGLTDIQRAARYYYLIRASFGADKRSYCCMGRGLDKSLERLEEVQQRLARVVIENQDFARILATYDRPHTLFYLDPPYYKAEGYYQDFGREDHRRLRDALLKVKGRFVLSYNDAPEIRELYAGFTVHAAERRDNLKAKNGAGQASYKELLITNYKPSFYPESIDI